ncbi:hypothetical protein ACFSVJ_19915 [Prauserella oleivorans]
MLGTSVAAFVIGMFILTGFELATGSSVSGQGRSTVGQLVGNTSGQSEYREDPGRQQEQEQTPAPSEQQQPGDETEPTYEPTESGTPVPSEEQQPTEQSEPVEPTEPSSPVEEQPEPTQEETESVPLPGLGGESGGGAEVTPSEGG